MTKIKLLPTFARPREKLFEKGASALKDYELLAILLRTGYQGKSALEIAQRILRTLPLKKLVQASTNQLAQIKGVGKSRAATIAAAFALSERVFRQGGPITVKTAEDVVKIVSFLLNKKKEYLVVLYLNAKDELITSQTISVGTLTANLVHPREVFSLALKNYAVRLVLVHNHPSRDPQPSESDLKVTKRMVEAGKFLGLEVVDHVIVAAGGAYFSFRQKNQALFS